MTTIQRHPYRGEPDFESLAHLQKVNTGTGVPIRESQEKIDPVIME